MKYPTVFHLISDVCKKTDISCILVGGFAVNFYKCARQTTDVDFLVTKGDFEKIFDLIKGEDYKEYYTHEIFTRLKSSRKYLADLDFMFVDKKTVEEIIEDGKEINIVEKKFVIPSLSHLIALKFHSIKYGPKIRELKDLPDIVKLIKVNKVDFKSKSFQELCLKYGTEESYRKVLEYLQ